MGKKGLYQMLIIVRHGESEANSVDAFAGHWNAELTEKGMEQAMTILSLR